MVSSSRNETLLLMCLILSVTGFVSASIFQHKRVTITMYNEVDGSKDLNISCKSGDNHLALLTIKPNGTYVFSFRPDFFETTRFTCKFAWDKNNFQFPIFVYDRDHPVCNICFWKIFTTGPCELNYDTSKYDLCHTWNETSSTVQKKLLEYHHIW
ncbi:S-protein homolog 29-like [Alnus glutinosa]|uniref:S-protein homolog 29-like n=1 Tax=Alnus glutinosa TaxID=3517 RepID=UPI002D7921B0|nr:S-protein homolog 29-like [Alnus glutinosa]